MCNGKLKFNFDPCLGLSQLVEKFIFIILNSDHLVQAPQTVQSLHDFLRLPGHKCGLHFSGMLLPINAVQHPRTAKILTLILSSFLHFGYTLIFPLKKKEIIMS